MSSHLRPKVIALYKQVSSEKERFYFYIKTKKLEKKNNN